MKLNIIFKCSPRVTENKTKARRLATKRHNPGLEKVNQEQRSNNETAATKGNEVCPHTVGRAEELW